MGHFIYKCGVEDCFIQLRKQHYRIFSVTFRSIEKSYILQKSAYKRGPAPFIRGLTNDSRTPYINEPSLTKYLHKQLIFMIILVVFNNIMIQKDNSEVRFVIYKRLGAFLEGYPSIIRKLFAILRRSFLMKSSFSYQA
ncbi:Hypothetical_protein [Hexamita inflata]|uniref:Hypothetical_protein n=1 Tax=Hexamita inflata TaxID=28002 RepID=A0AA86UQK9_9EUKA|nr:Hypothetical protein HINF_LOCUS34833 [Hexamita inflata]